MAKNVVSLWVTGTVSVVRNLHLAHTSLHSLGRGERPGQAGDTLLRFLLPPMLETHFSGDFLRHLLSKFTENAKPDKKQILLVCIMEAADKEISMGFATHPKDPGPNST